MNLSMWIVGSMKLYDCWGSWDTNKGLELMNQKKRCWVRPDSFVFNILIGGLCREKRVDDARQLFEEMLKRVVELHLYFVEADTNNFNPWNKNGGGFGLVYKQITALVCILVFVDDVGDQTIF